MFCQKLNYSYEYSWNDYLMDEWIDWLTENDFEFKVIFHVKIFLDFG